MPWSRKLPASKVIHTPRHDRYEFYHAVVAYKYRSHPSSAPQLFTIVKDEQHLEHAGDID